MLGRGFTVKSIQVQARVFYVPVSNLKLRRRSLTRTQHLESNAILSESLPPCQLGPLKSERSSYYRSSRPLLCFFRSLSMKTSQPTQAGMIVRVGNPSCLEHEALL